MSVPFLFTAAQVRRVRLRIPMMSAACSGAMSATDPNFMSAGLSD
jgi:hypothetical protein